MKKIDRNNVLRGTVESFKSGRGKGTGYGFVRGSGPRAGKAFFHINDYYVVKVDSNFYGEPSLGVEKAYSSERQPKAGDQLVLEIEHAEKGPRASWWAYADQFDQACGKLEEAQAEFERRQNAKARLKADIAEHGWPRLTLASVNDQDYLGGKYSSHIEKDPYDASQHYRIVQIVRREEAEVKKTTDLPPGVEYYSASEDRAGYLRISSLEALRQIEELVGPVSEWGIKFELPAKIILELGGECKDLAVTGEKATYKVSHPAYGQAECSASVKAEEMGYKSVGSGRSSTKVRRAGISGTVLEPVRVEIENALKPKAQATRHSLAFFELGRDLTAYRELKEVIQEQGYLRLIECLRAGHEPEMGREKVRFGAGDEDWVRVEDVRAFLPEPRERSYGTPQEWKDPEVLREALVQYLQGEFNRQQEDLNKKLNTAIEFEDGFWAYTPAGWYDEPVSDGDVSEADRAELGAFQAWWLHLRAGWEQEIREKWARYDAGKEEPQELPAPVDAEIEEQKKWRLGEEEIARRAESQELFQLYALDIRDKAARWNLALVDITSDIPEPEIDDGFLVQGIPEQVKFENYYIGGMHSSAWEVRYHSSSEAEWCEHCGKRFIENGTRWEKATCAMLDDGSIQFGRYANGSENKPCGSVSREDLFKFVRDKGVKNELISYIFYFLPDEQAKVLFAEIAQTAEKELADLRGKQRRSEDLLSFIQKWGVQFFNELWDCPSYLETEEGKRRLAISEPKWLEVKLSHKEYGSFVSRVPQEGTPVVLMSKSLCGGIATKAIAQENGKIVFCVPSSWVDEWNGSLAAYWLREGKLCDYALKLAVLTEVAPQVSALPEGLRDLFAPAPAPTEEQTAKEETPVQVRRDGGSFSYTHYRTSHKPGWDIYVILADGAVVEPDEERFSSNRQKRLRAKFTQIWSFVPDSAAIVFESRGSGKRQSAGELQFRRAPEELTEKQWQKLDELFSKERVERWFYGGETEDAETAQTPNEGLEEDKGDYQPQFTPQDLLKKFNR